jgi:hypothetical protein
VERKPRCGYTLPVQGGLPKWAVDDRTSIEAEAAPYRDLTSQERARHLAAACRAAARLVLARSDARAALEYVDPLPNSTVTALARLRNLERNRRRR